MDFPLELEPAAESLRLGVCGLEALDSDDGDGVRFCPGLGLGAKPLGRLDCEIEARLRNFSNADEDGAGVTVG